MVPTSAERILLHLHAFWNSREASLEMTQAGIAEGARILRSHVPRAVRSLERKGLVSDEDTHMAGRVRKTRIYRLTEAGVRRARDLIAALDLETVDVDGRTMALGEARRTLGVSAIEAIFAVDASGRFRPAESTPKGSDLIQRDEDLSALRRWMAGPGRAAVVYGSRGMGKTSLGRAFARGMPGVAWLDLAACSGAASFAKLLDQATGVRPESPADPASVSGALGEAADRGFKLLILDEYDEASEELVEILSAHVRRPNRQDPKILVLAQETTPAYCRFFDRHDVERGMVMERHLRGLDLEGCRLMLGRPEIDEEAFRRIYLLTKGCPLYLRQILDGDVEGLRANSRFTAAEIRLLLYSFHPLSASVPASV